MAALGVCHNGVGTLTFVEKGVKINQFVYLDTLKNVYHPDMEMIMGGDYVLQQDGATAHTAKSITKWIKEQGKFRLLEPWPSNSPDLNPLDYGIWSIAEEKVPEEKPTTEIALKCAIRKAVSGIPPEVARKTVAQFEKRLDICIANDGGVFEYKM